MVGLTIPAIYQIPFIIGNVGEELVSILLARLVGILNLNPIIGFVGVALELVGPTYRTFITVMTCLFYTLGMLILSGVAYVVRDWTHLCYATTLPFLVFFIYLVLVAG